MKAAAQETQVTATFLYLFLVSIPQTLRHPQKARMMAG